MYFVPLSTLYISNWKLLVKKQNRSVMKTSNWVSNRNIRRVSAGIATAIVVTLTGVAPAAAQAKPLETTAGWKAACENSPGNRVVLTEDITISLGATASSPIQINTPCTIDMINDAELQVDKVGLSFAGPLTINGGAKGGLAMQEAIITAPSVTLNLTGDEGYLRTSFSRINASAGDLNINFGRLGKVEMFRYRTFGTFGNVTNGTLFASGSMNVKAGELFNLSMNESVIYGGANMTIDVSGTEANLKAENTSFQGLTGNLLIIGRGAKTNAEFSNSTLRSGTDMDVVAGSTESNIKFSNVRSTVGGRAQVYTAGAKGNVNMSNSPTQAGTGIFISAIGAESNLIVENSEFSAATPVRFVSGALGKTVVVNSRITGTGLVDIQTNRAAGGVCEALQNRITAPQQQICP
jgi:hypothetical protein